MTETETSQIVIDKIPEPGTEAMAHLLHSVIEQVLLQLPFPFTAGDVMSAATVLLVDAGMISVTEGTSTCEKLLAVITKNVTEVINARQAESHRRLQ